MRRLWVLVVVLTLGGALLGSAAQADVVEVSGYLQPQLGFTYRPSGLPRDRFNYGTTATAAGLEFSGEPLARWRYDVHLVVEATLGGDGETASDSLTPNAPSVFVERAAIAFAAADVLSFELGQMRVPFTAQEQSPNTALLFPERAGPNEVFISGTDLGLVGRLDLGGGRLLATLGAFNGTGNAAGQGRDEGLLYAARVDVNPLGPFPFDEGDPQRGPLRLGLGLGALYRGTDVFDELGYFGLRVRDLRASASVRLAVRGFYLQAEALRRQRTDSLSARPEITTGAYVESSIYLPLRLPVGIAPMARLGWAAEDQGFAPRTTIWTEAGVTLYVRPEEPDKLKLTLSYLGEWRTTEGETAHGLLLGGQLVF